MSLDNQNLLGFDVTSSGTVEFVTVHLGDQLLGIPVLAVHDVLRSQNITPIPLSQDSIAGVLNLRGKIVTAIDLRKHLGFNERADDESYMCVVIEHRNEPYSFLIDKVGEVISVKASDYDKNPVTMDDRLREVSSGIFRLEGELLIVLDVEHLLDNQLSSVA